MIVSLSGKDRAAVISAGRHADAALWYDYRIPNFTTSTFYAKTLPGPIASWIANHPLSALLKPWTPEQPKTYGELLGPDEGPGEGSWLGFGTVFPHDPKAAEKPYSVLRTMPQLTEYMVDLTIAVADHEKVGEDNVTDLVMLSISGTDYVGHTFGAKSWEYLDQLIRTDRALGKLVRHLETKSAVSVLITADHGVSQLPEKNAEKGVRMFPDAIELVAETAATEALGEGDWVTSFAAPFIYLKSDLSTEDRQKASAAIIAALAEVDAIHGVYDVAAAKNWRDNTDRVKRAVGLSIADDTSGALYVLPKEHCIIDENRPRGKGTTHGTPWDHDARVPALFFGPGIKKQRVSKPLAQNRVAPTISVLLGIDPPKGVIAEPLPGAR